ncbi:MAG: 50S ribosomal protein L9 [Candidatus Caenarcaniphilales bacterium]|nr:50S ribosomal protein L9 [Candidatus Caenarcaniphilales bacterium]
MPVKLILKEDVDTLGKAGELVSVKSGYARNFLIPNGTAVIATLQNLLWLKKHKQNLEAQAKEKKQAAEEQKAALEGLGEVTLAVPVGPTGKLFGRITSKFLAEKLQELSGGKLALAHKQIKIDGYLHGADELGTYNVIVDFGSTVKGNLTIVVVEGQG